MTNYQKRVQHDVLVPREEYQDLYLIMRERHKGLIETWQEVTDPLKHVFEVKRIFSTGRDRLGLTDCQTSLGYRNCDLFDTLVEENIHGRGLE